MQPESTPPPDSLVESETHFIVGQDFILRAGLQPALGGKKEEKGTDGNSGVSRQSR
jgi:hypothetical protein